MSKTKTERSKKQQLGQFMTPADLSLSLVNEVVFNIDDKVLEPSFGDGSFILNLIDAFMKVYPASTNDKLNEILNNNIYGVELDKQLYLKCMERIKDKYGYIPTKTNLLCCDFLTTDFDEKFDYIIGNPPFGGTINVKHQDTLDKKYGKRFKLKIKKETYSFFLVKSIESLSDNGRIIFICSDTFLTINTMKGLRYFIMRNGNATVKYLDEFSDETDYPMVVIDFTSNTINDTVVVDDKEIAYETILSIPNYSWNIPTELLKYFGGEYIGDYMVCSSGMTVGKNEYFVREIKDGKITEKYDFSFFDDPITLKNELSKARLNKIGVKKRKEVIEAEKKGDTRRNVAVNPVKPFTITIPDNDYKSYNKANKFVIYYKPTHAVFWKDDGDAVYTFKKNGNWYLHGIGGKPFFGKEGLTWSLISNRVNAKYLPSGYILDSGAPIGVLKTGIKKDELYFIIGWLLTDTANDILKRVLNHTRNIQSKDIERMPYPFWVKNKSIAIKKVKDMIKDAKNGTTFLHTNKRVWELNRIYRK